MRRTIPLDRLEGLPDPDQGLTTEQVVTRAGRFGRNLILETVGGGWWLLVRATLKDPMLWFLLGTSVLFGFVGEWTEAVILLVALIPFLGMDAFLHRRTHASTEGLSSRLAGVATVWRDGARQVIASTELVPGDLVVVGVGETFPADGLVVRGERLQADESALTGEAYPVRKDPLAELLRFDGEAKVESEHWGFAGTRLLTGEAMVRIVYTGGETLYGEIVRSATRGAHARTPLQSAVGNLVTALLAVAAFICLMLAWVRYQQGHGLLDALLSAVTLAVAALPEEFPVVLTFFLGVGVYRLAKRQALVRRAVVVENIGRVSCICSDKTGTITEGRLRLTHQFPADDINSERLLQLAAAASRRATGDLMDLAILDTLAQPLGGEPVASFPFTEDRKRETGILRVDGALLAAVKGAPEVVLGLCTLPPQASAHWLARINELAGSGHKVIACAWRELDAVVWPGGEPDRDFLLAGLLAFEDPVRSGVPQALAMCQAARIHVIMVTGDHPATARAVAQEVGLGGAAPVVMEGIDMEARLQQGDAGFLRAVQVIARAVPAQKLTLVRALQAQGEIVAVTGDGVNDVPALQAADIGIAMGERGTRSAREVAAMVLLDDNFRSIVRAIAEGRQLFTNLQLSFQYLLMIHIPLVLTAALIPLAGYPLLYLPVHIVWLELIIHPTALLVFQELPGDGRLAPVTRSRQLRFFNRPQWFTIAAVGAALTAMVTFSYLRSLGAGLDVEHARAMALVALTVASAGITANLSRLRTRAAWLLVGGTIALSVLFVQTPLLAAFLHLKPLHGDDWLLAIAGGLIASLLSAITSVRVRSTGVPGIPKQ
ncbi:MAG TPA: cation-transporting P-type ATPase [Acidiferrobacterales bacterium]|nr:cation-transporting P-type ATPase [Acidiferrobacterales bacterium]